MYGRGLYERKERGSKRIAHCLLYKEQWRGEEKIGFITSDTCF